MYGAAIQTGKNMICQMTETSDKFFRFVTMSKHRQWIMKVLQPSLLTSFKQPFIHRHIGISAVVDTGYKHLQMGVGGVGGVECELVS